MGPREPLLDPTGGDAGGGADAQLAPRLASLSGLRVGLLGNAKPNAAANAGISAVADTFGPRGGSLPITRIDPPTKDGHR